MGMLSGKEIERQRQQGNIVIEPAIHAANPNSYNLRLGDRLLLYAKTLPLLDWWQRQYRYFENLRLIQPKTQFLVPADAMPLIAPLDMARQEETVELVIPTKGLLLYPGLLYLGHTHEYTETHGFVPCIEGRSSVGRLGMTVHITAGAGDVNFKGDWTCEITVLHALYVYAGTEVCQIFFNQLVDNVEPAVNAAGYEGKYQGQRGPKPSALWKEFGNKSGEK